MGLPSGNRWAVSNLDATGPYFFQESPFQYACSFFSWGNVTPHNAVDGTQFDYDFGTDYPNTPGYELTGNVPLTLDAARRLLSSPWKMPTSNDFDELFAYTDFIDASGEIIPDDIADKRTTVGDVVGIRLRSRFNGAVIFFAASGYVPNLTWSMFGNTVVSWSTTRYDPTLARALWVSPGSYNPKLARRKTWGVPIRPIWNPDDLRR